MSIATVSSPVGRMPSAVLAGLGAGAAVAAGIGAVELVVELVVDSPLQAASMAIVLIKNGSAKGRNLNLVILATLYS